MNTVPWPFFEHACVINLDARVDRWNAMQATLSHFNISGIRRFSAIRPSDSVVQSEAVRLLYAFLQRIDGDTPQLAEKVRGTWGCLQSHLAVIRMARDATWPHVLILEDDSDFESFALPVLRQVTDQLQSQEWDLLYLGGSFKKGGQKSRFSDNLLAVTRVRLAHAYVVNSRIYDRILNEAESSGMPIDWYYSEVLQPQVKTFIVVPTLINQRMHDMSDIEGVMRKPKLKFRKMFSRAWNRMRFWRRSP
jgi:glycosyl transferase family 25